MNIYTETLFVYYVYAYLRTDGSPYYIGKGKGFRCFYSHRSKKDIKPKKNNSNIILLARSLLEQEACLLEKKYIKKYGRKDLETGILLNRTDGGEGLAGLVRCPVSENTKRKLSNITLENWNKNPEKRIFQGEKIKNSFNVPGRREKNIEAAKKYHKNPNNLKNKSIKIKEWHQRENPIQKEIRISKIANTLKTTSIFSTNNPNSKITITPLGIFNTITEARKAHNMKPDKFDTMFKKFPNLYKKLPASEYYQKIPSLHQPHEIGHSKE